MIKRFQSQTSFKGGFRSCQTTMNKKHGYNKQPFTRSQTSNETNMADVKNNNSPNLLYS